MYHPLGKSDHVVLKIDYVIPVVYKNNIEKYRFYKGDFIGLNNHLNNANWEKNKKLENVHDMWDELLCNVNQAVSKFIPRSKKGMRKGPEWLDKTDLEAVKYKHKMWNKFQKQRTSENWSTYVQVRNRATKIVKLAKRNFERRVVMEIKSNPKNFWNMVNRKTKMKPGITDLETKEGNKITAQLANTIQADIGQMPSNRYRHIGPMRVADLGPSGFAPWANGDSTSAPHQQTQQPSIGPMMGRCLAFLNRPDAGSTSACHRHTHQPSIGPMMR